MIGAADPQFWRDSALGMPHANARVVIEHSLKPFFASSPGRILLVASAVALFSGAAYVLVDSIMAFAIGMPVTIACALVAAGLSIGEYPKEALFVVMIGPVALFLLGIGIGVAGDSRPVWGYGFALLGVIAAGLALRKGTQ